MGASSLGGVPWDELYAVAEGMGSALLGHYDRRSIGCGHSHFGTETSKEIRTFEGVTGRSYNEHKAFSITQHIGGASRLRHSCFRLSVHSCYVRMRRFEVGFSPNSPPRGDFQDDPNLPNLPCAGTDRDSVFLAIGS